VEADGWHVKAKAKILDKQNIPMLLTRTRLVLGPIILLCVFLRAAHALIGSLLILGLLTDIFDGVIARKLKVVTAELRVADGITDNCYHWCIIFAILLFHWKPVVACWPGLLLITVMSAVTALIDHIKYRKGLSLHNYADKFWAFTFFVFAFATLTFNQTFPWLYICILAGVYSNIEGYVIRWLLPLWAHDILGIPAAIKLRKVQLAEIASSHHQQ
jgi:CDP-diacylglycerol---glycerol-3-phosphate 3-phosphatidyltransferase